jgi:hypothetical protein
MLLARAHTAYTGSENACWRAYLSSSGRGRPRAVSVSIPVKFPVERKYACTIASRSNGCNSAHSSIDFRRKPAIRKSHDGRRAGFEDAAGFTKYGDRIYQVFNRVCADNHIKLPVSKGRCCFHIEVVYDAVSQLRVECPQGSPQGERSE